MPPSLDQPSSYQHLGADTGPLYQEEATRRRSPGRIGQGKSRKKYEAVTDNVEEETAVRESPNELISSPILSQLRPPTAPPHSLSNGTKSPLLEAWNPQPTSHNSDGLVLTPVDWPRNMSTDRSPPGVNIDGANSTKPPPRQQPSFEELGGGFSRASPPTSPRTIHRQITQRSSDYQSFGDHIGSSPNNRRPRLVHSPNSRYPPLPHHPQAHFYGAPEIDFGISNMKLGSKLPADRHYCVYDSLTSLGHNGSKSTEDVVLVGFRHGISVYHIDSKKLDLIGHLDGLRGSVIGAKILPLEFAGSSLAVHPLIIAIIHGPFVAQANIPEVATGHADGDEFDASGSMLQALQEADVTQYQTTVEVYSLRTSEHVATLFRSPKTEAIASGYDRRPSEPPAVGDLRIQASGRFSILSSGSSGEVFIFESSRNGGIDTSLDIRCIGKVWTQIMPGISRSTVAPSNEFDSGGSQDPRTTGKLRPDTPIVSLNHRWLAVSPPASSAHTTLHGQVDIDRHASKIPGLDSHTPPTEPQTTCELDTPNNQNMFNKAARDLAQGVLKGTQWVAAEGYQAWMNYWSKPPSQYQQTPAASPPNHAFTAPFSQQAFPPTHALETSVTQSKNRPSLVSILDLEKFSQAQNMKPSHALQPLATFALPLGCSTLSFSPNGLNLVTASAKGDDQHVWDLMRMIHGEAGRAGDSEASPKPPTVRQVAHFSRMTEARIVDIVWAEPKGERLAIITEKGTVHIYELPSTAFLWPPYRGMQRATPIVNNSEKSPSKGEDDLRPESAGNTFSSAFGMLTGKTQPLIAVVRGRSPSTSGGYPGFGALAVTAGAGAKGSRAVAAGINRSVSAAAAGTINSIRYMGENRLTLPTSYSAVAPGCARWMSGRSQGHIAVMGGELLRVYSIHKSKNPKARQRRPSVIGSKPLEFHLSKALGPEQLAPNQYTGSRAPADKTSSTSFWRPHSSNPSTWSPNGDMHPLSYAEIETNAAYQPFHTDKRVHLHVYDPETQDSELHHTSDLEAWAFGERITGTKISVVATARNEDDSDSTSSAQMENIITTEGNAEDGGQIVMTARRRRGKKGGKRGLGKEADFFEDDCEVIDFAEDRV